MPIQTVVILDATPLSRMILSQEALFSEVIHCKDPECIMDAVKDKDIDLFIVSAFSVKNTGFDAVREIRNSEKIREKPIIMMSSTFNDHVIRLAFACGANAFISKSDFIEDLKSVISILESDRQIFLNTFPLTGGTSF